MAVAVLCLPALARPRGLHLFHAGETGGFDLRPSFFSFFIITPSVVSDRTDRLMARTIFTVMTH